MPFRSKVRLNTLFHLYSISFFRSKHFKLCFIQVEKQEIYSHPSSYPRNTFPECVVVLQALGTCIVGVICIAVKIYSGASNYVSQRQHVEGHV